MEKKPTGNDESLDLKHDTMEYAAPAEGEDRLDTDDEQYEEEGISAEELEAINDTDDNEAAALVAEENDFLSDDSNLPDEDWTDDLPDNQEADDNNRERL